jgi:hypothetical protein
MPSQEPIVKFRTAALLAAPLACALAVSADAKAPVAAPAPLVMTDQTKDGNGLSDQGLVETPLPEGTATPADNPAFDIKSLTVAATGSVVKRKVGGKMTTFFDCTGFTATIELSGAPLLTGTLYRVQGATPLHATFWLEMSNPADGPSVTTLRYTDEAATLGTSSVVIKPAAVSGSKITFTVNAANLKATGGERLGKTVWSGFGADVRTNGKVQGSGATAPMWDQLRTDGSQVWKVCPA